MNFEIFDHLIDGAIVFDQNFKVLYINQSCLQNLDTGAGRVLGKEISAVFNMEPEPFRKDEILNAKQALPYHKTKIKCGDKELSAQIAIQPISGSPSRWLMLINNLTVVEELAVKYSHELKASKSLIETLNQKLSALSLLYDISQAIHFSTNVEQVVNLVLLKLESSFSFAGSMALFFDQEPFSVHQMMTRRNGGTHTHNSLVEISEFDFFLATTIKGMAPAFFQKGACPAFEAFLEQQSGKPVENYLLVTIKSLENLGLIALINQEAAHVRSQEEMDLIANLGMQMILAADIFNYYEKSIRDGLTGLANSRHFKVLLENEMKRVRRANCESCLLLLDIDHFKKFNDSFGHAIGDQVLKKVAGIMNTSFRTSDTPARYGGEEFVVLLPDTALFEAQKVAERLRKRIESNHLDSEFGHLKVTVSIGVASSSRHAGDPQALLECADQAMYLAKNTGRNRVVTFTHELKTTG